MLLPEPPFLCHLAGCCTPCKYKQKTEVFIYPRSDDTPDSIQTVKKIVEVRPSDGLHSSTSAFATDLQHTSKFDGEEGLRHAAESKHGELYQKVRYATICVRPDAGYTVYKYICMYID